ncbi:MAG: uroporphyrinogen decarboxylase family protein [Armatimonadota bacterium]|nr:uroporphyrinogen decarboxylase family protein [Armatimonadota bacterium]
MNDRERFNRILRFEPVDKVPNYELGGWPQTFSRWASEGMRPDGCHRNWFEGEPYLGLAPRGFAHVNVAMLPVFDYEVLEEDERYITARNCVGIVTKALKEGTEDGVRMSMDQYLAHPVTDRKSFEAIKKRYDPTAPVRYPLWWDELVRMWKTRDYPLCLLGNGTFGLYSQLRSWVGTEEISTLFYDDPALVEEMLDFNTDFLLATIEKALNEVQFDYFNFFEDLAGKGGPLVSPNLFRRFLMPQYKRITERMRKAGIEHFWVDSDGDPEVLIPLWIESGITCFWPLEQASGMDPRRLRKEYGKDLALAGGLDKIELTKDKKAIENELRAKIPPMLDSGGYIPHLDHCFPPDISYENFKYYMEVKSQLIGGR